MTVPTIPASRSGQRSDHRNPLAVTAGRSCLLQPPLGLAVAHAVRVHRTSRRSEVCPPEHLAQACLPPPGFAGRYAFDGGPAPAGSRPASAGLLYRPAADAARVVDPDGATQADARFVREVAQPLRASNVPLQPRTSSRGRGPAPGY